MKEGCGASASSAGASNASCTHATPRHGARRTARPRPTAHGHGAWQPSRQASPVTPACTPTHASRRWCSWPSIARLLGVGERRLAMEDNKRARYFAHEKLDVYRLAFEVVEFVAARRDKL